MYARDTNVVDWDSTMHEVSIACDLVELAEAAAHTAHADSVVTVHLKLGIFSGVMKDALYFAYENVTKGTILEGSFLDIQDVPLVIYCTRCQQESTLQTIQDFHCPRCNHPDTQIRHGTEIELVSLEIPDYANALT